MISKNCFVHCSKNVSVAKKMNMVKKFRCQLNSAKFFRVFGKAVLRGDGHPPVSVQIQV